jgi:hypothetical protein
MPALFLQNNMSELHTRCKLALQGVGLHPCGWA